MQIKLVSLPSPPPSSPSPNPNDQSDPLAGYSLQAHHLLFILIIVFIVFISCDYIWQKLIVKLNDDNPTTTTTTATSSSSSRAGSSTNHGTVVASPPIVYLPPRPRPPPLVNIGGSGGRDGRRVGEVNMCSECVICLKEFRYSDLCRVLPNCNHTFHAPCIDGWTVIKRSCPICRSSIQPFNL